VSYTNETMPEWSPKISIDRLSWELSNHEKKFWQDRYLDVVRRFENIVDACKEYGYVEITWGHKTFKFTVEEIK